MPDTFDSAGLQVASLSEIRSALEAALKVIYGSDVNLDANTPDGQLINIFAQSGVDLRELLQSVNSGFDLDTAYGTTLDRLCAIIGVKRNAGGFTIQDVEIVTDRALNLVGLDGDLDVAIPEIENLYTVRDDAGNEFYLADSQTIISAGTYSFAFRAANIGQVQVTLNTITTPVTVVPGVTGVNNPTSAASVGTNQETDAALRFRAKSSTSIKSVGFLDGIRAAIGNLDNVTTVIVRENNTNATDSDGIPPYSIWCIVEGGDDNEIASAIFAKKSAGAGMKGSTTVNVTRVSGDLYPVNFDRPVAQDLYIRFNLDLPGGVFDSADIKQKIVDSIIWSVGADAVGSTITSFLVGLNSNYVITSMEVSDDGAAWAETVSVSSAENRFVNDVSRITVT